MGHPLVLVTLPPNAIPANLIATRNGHAHLKFAGFCSPVFVDEDTEERPHVCEACGARFKRYDAQTSGLLLSIA